MFKVKYIDGKTYDVYGVRTDTFLIYQNGLWRWVYMHDCELAHGESHFTAQPIMQNHD